MPLDISVKICGLRRPQEVTAVADAGGRYVGFTFFEKSPRSVDIASAAPLAASVPVGICKVALTVNADDAFLDSLTQGVALDMLQLHGSESVERVAHVKARYGLPVMKAIGVAEAADLEKIDLYSGVADQLLIDAKPPKDAELPGGNGLAFDWQLLAGRVWRSPWMLAGGLTPDNVAEAIQRTGAYQVDVASGVESSAGVKDATLIDALIQAARQA